MPANALSLVSISPVLSGNTAASTDADAYPNLRRHYHGGPERKWQEEVVSRITQLTAMRPNWDSYGAAPIKWDAGMFALAVLDQTMLPRTPVPQIVPVPTGGIQIEWHERDLDIEFQVEGPYDCELCIQDHRSTGDITCNELTDDFSQLAAALRVLTRR